MLETKNCTEPGREKKCGEVVYERKEKNTVGAKK